MCVIQCETSAIMIWMVNCLPRPKKKFSNASSFALFNDSTLFVHRNKALGLRFLSDGYRHGEAITLMDIHVDYSLLSNVLCLIYCIQREKTSRPSFSWFAGILHAHARAKCVFSRSMKLWRGDQKKKKHSRKSPSSVSIHAKQKWKSERETKQSRSRRG